MVANENREKAIKLLDKIKSEKPEVYGKAEISIKQEGTKLYIFINNMSAFDESTKNVILKWMNSIKSFC
jgi:hypothetical protein